MGYFEAGFVAPQHTELLRTGPQDDPTHWKQTVLYLKDPIPVHIGVWHGIETFIHFSILCVCVCVCVCVCAGDVLEGTIAIARRKRDQRALDISLCFTLSSSLSLTQSLTDNHKYSHMYVLR